MKKIVLITYILISLNLSAFTQIRIKWDGYFMKYDEIEIFKNDNELIVTSVFLAKYDSILNNRDNVIFKRDDFKCETNKAGIIRALGSNNILEFEGSNGLNFSEFAPNTAYMIIEKDNNKRIDSCYNLVKKQIDVIGLYGLHYIGILLNDSSSIYFGEYKDNENWYLVYSEDKLIELEDYQIIGVLFHETAHRVEGHPNGVTWSRKDFEIAADKIMGQYLYKMSADKYFEGIWNINIIDSIFNILPDSIESNIYPSKTERIEFAKWGWNKKLNEATNREITDKKHEIEILMKQEMIDSIIINYFTSITDFNQDINKIKAEAYYYLFDLTKIEKYRDEALEYYAHFNNLGDKTNFQLGKIHFDKINYGKAISCFILISNDSEYYSQSRFYLGKIYEEIYEDLPIAIKYYKASYNSDKSRYDAYERIADIQQQQNNWQTSINSYNIAINSVGLDSLKLIIENKKRKLIIKKFNDFDFLKSNISLNDSLLSKLGKSDKMYLIAYIKENADNNFDNEKYSIAITWYNLLPDSMIIQVANTFLEKERFDELHELMLQDSTNFELEYFKIKALLMQKGINNYIKAIESYQTIPSNSKTIYETKNLLCIDFKDEIISAYSCSIFNKQKKKLKKIYKQLECE